ncbi:MAG: Hpt domain-containing protein [Pseudomonadota bacterium]
MSDQEKIVVQIDPDIIELIPGFLDNRKNDVTRIRDLLAAKDFAQIKLLGHSMKGAGGGYGFDEITSIGAVIESAADAEDSGGISDGADRLEKYLSQIEVVAEQ